MRKLSVRRHYLWLLSLAILASTGLSGCQSTAGGDTATEKPAAETASTESTETPGAESAEHRAGSDEVVLAVSDSTFDAEVLKSSKPVLVDFWAPWCGPCKAVAPVVHEVATEMKDRAKFVKLNTDENPATAQQYNIRGIPALLVFKNGKVVDQIVGAVPKRKIVDLVSKHVQ